MNARELPRLVAQLHGLHRLLVVERGLVQQGVEDGHERLGCELAAARLFL
jgi:hypothetical protein